MLLVTASGAAGQATGDSLGSRIRVAVPSVREGRWTGVLLARTADTLTVRDEDGLVRSIPITSIAQLERSLGRSHMVGALKGALWGTGAGLALALLNVGFSNGNCDENEGDCVSTIVGVITWTSLGTGIGIGIGGLIGSEQWEPLDFGTARSGSGLPVRTSERFSPGERYHAP